MKLTDEQIQRVKRLIPSQPSRLDREAIIALLADRQAWKEEAELLTKHSETQDQLLSSVSKQQLETGIKLNQAAEVIKRVHKYAKENSPDSKYLEQVQVELDHFLSQ